MQHMLVIPYVDKIWVLPLGVGSCILYLFWVVHSVLCQTR
jgi:hypothetical protein